MEWSFASNIHSKIHQEISTGQEGWNCTSMKVKWGSTEAHFRGGWEKVEKTHSLHSPPPPSHHILPSTPYLAVNKQYTTQNSNFFNHSSPSPSPHFKFTTDYKYIDTICHLCCCGERENLRGKIRKLTSLKHGGISLIYYLITWWRWNSKVTNSYASTEHSSKNQQDYLNISEKGKVWHKL